ncbi:MAG: FAD-dependent oxidoreductase [Thermoprotei archaeon]|nr:FAD-dependent oxidoreductase [Thermoprotei archaeon]
MPLPVIKRRYDVIVVGGGLAGLCAAIAAARHGCKTALIEARPVLGGNSSSLIRVNPTGACTFNSWARETGIIEEVITEYVKRSHLPIRNGLITSLWDLTLYEMARAEDNLDLYLDTVVFDVEMSSSTKIGAVRCLQIGSELMYKLYADYFIDCTGDGTVGALAGAEYRLGREARSEFNETPIIAPEKADKQTQGSTLMFKSVATNRKIPFKPPPWAEKYPTEDSLYMRWHNPMVMPDGTKVYSGYWWIEIGVPYDTIHQNSEIRDELLRHLLGVWDHIKNYGNHDAENLALEWIGFIPGKRESRRLIGDYILTEHDVKSQKLFPDRVAYGGWFIDVHTMGGILAKDRPPEHLAGNPDLSDELVVELYSIPFRCLYSRNIENLLMAGRDISVTHVALGTTRVMMTCAVLGQAVGTAATLCKKYGVTPRELCKDGRYLSELQQTLLKDDCFIPDLPNQDPQDLARTAKVVATSHAMLKLEPIGGERPLNVERCLVFPVSEDRVDRVYLWLRSYMDKEMELTIEFMPVSSIWSLNEEPKEEPVKATTVIPPLYEGWARFDLNASVRPGRLYRVNVPMKEGLCWAQARPLPGVVAGWKKTYWKRWRHEHVAYALRLDPPSYPFRPENVINGYARPYKWTNIWISDPDKELPQSITLDFGKEVRFDTVYLTFDTNLNLETTRIPPLYVFPECVRDYAIKILDSDGSLKTIVEVQDNYRRRRVHKFEPVTTQKLRIEVYNTNGDPSARIYEIRVYNET